MTTFQGDDSLANVDELCTSSLFWPVTSQGMSFMLLHVQRFQNTCKTYNSNLDKTSVTKSKS